METLNKSWTGAAHNAVFVVRVFRNHRREQPASANRS